MQEQKMVSIIVPVYKVEKYLPRCLDSLVSQTYPNIEVILVDDGSPDRCGSICEEYASRYPLIHVIHQENQGQAAARNRAVKCAAGDWILFVDSDDFVTEDCVSYLISLQEKFDADIAIAGYKYVYEHSANITASSASKKAVEVKLDTVEALKRLNYTQGYGAFPWAKLYRRELIVNHPFPEGQIYEDLAVLYQIIGDSQSVAYGNQTVYFWMQRQGSTMRSAFSDKQMAALDATSAQIEYVGQRYPEALLSAKARHEAKIAELMAIALKSEHSKSNFRLLKQASRYYKEVMSDPRVKKSMKLRMAAIRMGYLPAKLIFKLHEMAKERKYSR